MGKTDMGDVVAVGSSVDLLVDIMADLSGISYDQIPGRDRFAGSKICRGPGNCGVFGHSYHSLFRLMVEDNSPKA